MVLIILQFHRVKSFFKWRSNSVNNSVEIWKVFDLIWFDSLLMHSVSDLKYTVLFLMLIATCKLRCIQYWWQGHVLLRQCLYMLLAKGKTCMTFFWTLIWQGQGLKGENFSKHHWKTWCIGVCDLLCKADLLFSWVCSFKTKHKICHRN